MTDKKLAMNEAELNDVAGGSWQDMVDWFHKRYDEILEKHKNGPQKIDVNKAGLQR